MKRRARRLLAALRFVLRIPPVALGLALRFPIALVFTVAAPVYLAGCWAMGDDTRAAREHVERILASAWSGR